jgi:hypothetical protein
VHCPRCGAETVATASLFHSTHQAGLWIGLVALALAAAGAVWIAWSVWRAKPDRAAPEVLPVAYASCVALFVGIALVWRYRAATTSSRW